MARDRKKMHAAQKRHTQNNRAYMNGRKLQIGKCAHCGKICNENNLRHFHWDHLDPSTKVNRVGAMVGRAQHVIAREIEKCQLLCRYCHHKRTYLEKHWTFRKGAGFKNNQNSLLSLFDEDEHGSEQ